MKCVGCLGGCCSLLVIKVKDWGFVDCRYKLWTLGYRGQMFTMKHYKRYSVQKWTMNVSLQRYSYWKHVHMWTLGNRGTVFILKQSNLWTLCHKGIVSIINHCNLWIWGYRSAVLTLEISNQNFYYLYRN